MHCLNCIRCMQNSTFETGLNTMKTKRMLVAFGRKLTNIPEQSEIFISGQKVKS